MTILEFLTKHLLGSRLLSGRDTPVTRGPGDYGLQKVPVSHHGYLLLIDIFGALVCCHVNIYAVFTVIEVMKKICCLETLLTLFCLLICLGGSSCDKCHLDTSVQPMVRL